MVWRFLIKLNIELPYDPVILLLGIYSEEMKSKFIAALFTVAKTWNNLSVHCPQQLPAIPQAMRVEALGILSRIGSRM